MRAVTQHMAARGRSRVALTCPTGAAARVASSPHLHGVTIHKYFNVQSRLRDPEHSKAAQRERRSKQELELAAVNVDADFEECKEETVRGLPTAIVNSECEERFRSLKTLVIDEISMVSADFLSLISDALQLVRDSKRPFGGVQVIATGDFWQLAPVCTTGEARWAFQSPLWTFDTCELTHCVRQRGDVTYAKILGRMRVGATTPEDVAYINRNSRKAANVVPHTTLSPYNKQCDAINRDRVDAMPGNARDYKAELSIVELLENRPFWRTRPYATKKPIKTPSIYCKTPLRIKVNTVVRSTRNVYREPRGIHDMVVCNGQRGVVTRLGPDDASVRWDPVGDEPPVSTIVRPTATLRRQSFDSARGLPVYAVVHSLALKPAFAITTHSSQGSSLKGCVDVDVTSRQPPPSGKGNWVTKPASCYVALSRVEALAACRLTVPLHREHIAIDPVVASWARAGYPKGGDAPAASLKVAT